MAGTPAPDEPGAEVRVLEVRVDEPPARAWALLRDEGRWPEVTDRVTRVDLLHPGDAHGNGRLRRVVPTGRFGTGTAFFERVSDVAHHRAFTVDALHHDPVDDQRLRIELRTDGRGCVVRLVERRAPPSWALRRWHALVDREHRGSVQHALVSGMGDWLARHGDYGRS